MMLKLLNSPVGNHGDADRGYDTAWRTFDRARRLNDTTWTLQAARTHVANLTVAPGTPVTDEELESQVRAYADTAAQYATASAVTFISSTITSRLDISGYDERTWSDPVDIETALTRNFRLPAHLADDSELVDITAQIRDVCELLVRTASSNARRQYDATLQYWSDTDGLITVHVTGHTAGDSVTFILLPEKMEVEPHEPIVIVCDSRKMTDDGFEQTSITYQDGNPPFSWRLNPKVQVDTHTAEQDATVTVTAATDITVTANTAYGNYPITAELAAHLTRQPR
jgi:hypothetical protein